MPEQSLYIYCLIGWLLAVLVTMYSQWWSGMGTVGLGFMYLLNMAINHFFGGIIYILPWYSTSNAKDVALGFEAATYAVGAFAAGNAIFTPLLVKWLNWPIEKLPEGAPDQRIALLYVAIALLCYFVLIPLLGDVPTLGAALNSGWALLVVGLSLLCWQAYRERKARRLLSLLALIPLLPFLTVITQGFLGYGVISATIILTFFACFYASKWHVVMMFFGGLYMGLSVFVTYIRDRSLIRDSVWGAESYGSRLDRMIQTFREFEFFDIYSLDHLALIDLRLNQNILVGAAVNYLSQGSVSFAEGETIWNSILALVPRFLWADKPFQAGSGGLVTKYTGIPFAEGTSVGIGQVMEFYVNFGYAGILIGFFVFGLILGFLDKAALARLKSNDWQGFALFFLPGLGMLQVGGSLGEVTTTSGASLIVALLINRAMASGLLDKVIKKKDVKEPGYSATP